MRKRRVLQLILHGRCPHVAADAFKMGTAVSGISCVVYSSALNLEAACVDGDVRTGESVLNLEVAAGCIQTDGVAHRNWSCHLPAVSGGLLTAAG